MTLAHGAHSRTVMGMLAWVRGFSTTSSRTRKTRRSAMTRLDLRSKGLRLLMSPTHQAADAHLTDVVRHATRGRGKHPAHKPARDAAAAGSLGDDQLITHVESCAGGAAHHFRGVLHVLKSARRHEILEAHLGMHAAQQRH